MGQASRYPAQAPMVATSRPMINAPLLAVGASVLKSSVMAKMPSTRIPVSTISSMKACMGVMPAPG